MAVQIGTVTIRLLASVGDGAPIEIGTLPIPVRGGLTGQPEGASVTVDRDPALTRRTLKRALRRAARAL